ncbi:MAG: hypothetical protein CBC73_02920 [Flavobacteriales bacterium TMED113]|nr:MAG: hypothetical protein CBC73_02920 [Flavobacteriales bacterium TMED113]
MKKNILFVAQELSPYTIGDIGQRILDLAAFMQSKDDIDVRIFIPRFGCINQRKHQLHEVIRLSGVNLVINDIDQPLIIKVGSVSKQKLQVYFIDNEEYFKRKQIFKDNDGKLFVDNDERMLFFCKGVLETLLMLGWKPDLVHCHGWITSMLPMYLKTRYSEDSLFNSTHIITSLYNKSFVGMLNKDLAKKVLQDDQIENTFEFLKKPNAIGLYKHASKFSDAIIFNKGFSKINEIKEVLPKDVPTLGNGKDELTDEEYYSFYKNSLTLETA